MHVTGDGDDAERFHPTNGRIGGAVGIVVAVGVIAYGALSPDAGYPAWVFPAAVLVGVLSWTTLFRPDVRVEGDRLLLRHPYSTQSLPLAGIETVTVHRVLEVRIGGKRFVNPAVGRSGRQIIRDTRQPVEPETFDSQRSYAHHVESKIGDLVAAARATHDVAPGSDEQAAFLADVRRQWAWPEIVVTGATVLALVIALV